MKSVHDLHRAWRAVALLALAASPHVSWALAPNVEVGLEVSGLVTVAPTSSQQQSVIALPLSVSQLVVADTAPGVFDYLSSADIGLLELKIFGSLSNGSANPLGNGETPSMRVRSEVRDVLTLTSELLDPYPVTFELQVHGAVTGSGSAVANAVLDFGLLGGSHGNDSGAYFFGVIDDTLTVTRLVSGASVDMNFAASLNFAVTQVAALSTVTGALDNTATMRLILPPGVSLSNSGSGTFGVPIPAVPEPGSWALMLAGAVVLAGLGQGRRAGTSGRARRAAATA